MAGRYAEQWRSCPGAQLFSDPLHDARSRAPAYGVTPNHEHPTRAVPLPRFNSGRRMTGWASSSGMKFSMLRHALGRRKACTSRIAVDWLVVLERTGRRRSKDHPRPLQAKPPNELLPSKEKPDRKPVKSPSWRPPCEAGLEQNFKTAADVGSPHPGVSSCSFTPSYLAAPFFVSFWRPEGQWSPQS